MKYLILTKQFDKEMFFMEHHGPGFGITTDLNLALIVEGLAEAERQAGILREASGMDCFVRKLGRQGPVTFLRPSLSRELACW
jgi:hypothetical protein